MSAISNLSSNYLQSILSASQSNGLTNNQSTNGAGATTPAGQAPDNGQLSPLAQMMNELQQLQQSNPTEYQQVTQQIATNLLDAAQTAQTNGNSTEAGQLNTLATDFSDASQTGQLPNLQDLAHALGGGHGHHQGYRPGGDSSNTTGGTTSTASQTPPTTTGDQNESLNPLTIIQNTLANAGIGSGG